MKIKRHLLAFIYILKTNSVFNFFLLLHQLCIQLFSTITSPALLSGESDIFGLPDFSFFFIYGGKYTKMA